MTEREALKLTLAALKQIDAAMPFPVAKLAIRKAEEALVQPKQKRPQNCGTGYCSCIECVMEPEQIPPSAYSNTHQPEQEQIQPDKVCIEDDGCPTEKAVLQRFWREHQKTQPEQEPVAWGMEGKDGFIFDVICPAEHDREEGGYTTPLYTTPPQRTWVGLTDEEMERIEDMSTDRFDAIRLTEDKLKEKNT